MILMEYEITNGMFENGETLINIFWKLSSFKSKYGSLTFL